MKTLADLKRDAKSGTLEGRFTFHSMWQDGLPERLQGWRRLVDSNSVAIFFQNADGKKSELRLEKSSLVEYDGNSLTVYFAGYRDLNAAERKVMDGWNKIASTPEYQERGRVDALTDGSSTYWEKVSYFRKAGMEYLMGNERQRGLKYDSYLMKVQDDSIKGEVGMRYENRKEA